MMDTPVPPHVTKVAIRSALQMQLIRHRPVYDPVPESRCCMQCGEYWPCATFRSVLLNLQIERLFYIFKLFLAAEDQQTAADIVRRIQQNGDPKGTRGR